MKINVNKTELILLLFGIVAYSIVAAIVVVNLPNNNLKKKLEKRGNNNNIEGLTNMKPQGLSGTNSDDYIDNASFKCNIQSSNCCKGSTYSGSDGCVCITTEQIKLLDNRGGNCTL